MKISIKQEKSGDYFAQIVGDVGVHAVGETPDLALEYLIDVYEQVSQLRAEEVRKRLFLDRALVNEPLFSTGFKSLTLSL